MSPDSLVYTSSKGVEIDLGPFGGFMRTGEGDPLRSREWDATLGFRKLYSATRPARSVKLSVVTSREEADRACEAFDLDVSETAPGTLTLGEWSQSALVTASSADVWRVDTIELTVTVALLDGVWRRPRAKSFMKSAQGGGGWLDYPHGYPYGLGSPSPVTDMDCGLGGVPKITVYGPAVNPYVIIAGNRYEVDVTVPAGGYLVIDALKRTVKMTDQAGVVTDCFADAKRGSGEGSGEYVFQPVPGGSVEVSWDNSFGFDVTVYEERGEATWC